MSMYIFYNKNVIFKLFMVVYVEFACVEVVSSQFPRKVVKVCVTDACFRAAEKMKVMMKDTVRPCDNFYRFACGNYIELADLTANTMYYNTDLDESQMDKIILQIKDELEKPSSDHELKPFRLAKKLYRQCITSNVLGKQEVATIKKYFKSFGGWPVLKGAAWDQNNISWVDVNTKFYKNGFFSRGIISTEIALNPVNTSQYVIQVSSPKLSIKKHYLLRGFRGSVVKAYHKYMTEVAVIFGADRTQALKELKDIVKFEIQLAKIINAVDKSNPDFSIDEDMQLFEIKRIFPNIPTEDIIVKTFQIKSLENISDLVINMNEPEYFLHLGKLLQKYNKRVVINYLFWRAIDMLFGDIPLLDTTEHVQLLAKLYTNSVKPPKDELCTELVSESMKIAVGALYVRRYSSKVMKNLVTQMIEKLQTEVIKLVLSLDWMGRKSQIRASEKVRNIDMFVSYPEEFLDDSKLETYFEKLQFESGNNFVENLLAITKFNKKMPFNLHGTFANKTDWKRTDSVTNIYAYYKPHENTVFIPAALLQEFYIHEDRPMYVNYGALASLIAHEILHSLDTDGQLHDKHGNAGEILFSEETRDRYEKKAIALSKHYSSYTVEEVKMKLDGLRTKEEGIMDQAGLKIAHASYKTWVNENGEDPRMPLLEKYTPLQLFWVQMQEVIVMITQYAELKVAKMRSCCPNDMAEMVSDKAAEQVKEILESPINSHDIRPFKLAKKLYRLCMEEEKFGLKHVEQVNKYLQIFGGWPVVEGRLWNEKKFNWIHLIKQLIKYGFQDDSIFNIVTGVSFINTSQRIIDADQPDLIFERQYLIKGLRGKEVKAYYKYMLDVVTSFGAEKALASVELKESLQFEIQIAKITNPAEKRHQFGKQYNTFTLARLVKVYPYIPWGEVLSMYTNKNMSAMPDLLINVSAPEYYRRLGLLLKKTKKRVLANYLIWRTVSDYIQMLPTIAFQSQLDLLNKITGRNTFPPKFESCGDVTGHCSWISLHTAFALKKAEAMEFHVAYPDEFSEDKKIEEFYKKLDFPNNYLLSTLILNAFTCNASFSDLDKLINRSDWTLHSGVHEINACYAPQENSIGVPAALLQEVFFEKDRPMYMNYGSIGSVIAHEVTHGFDDDGRYFDQYGNLFSWWSEESTKNYDMKAQHFISHYSNYTISDIKMKVDETLEGCHRKDSVICETGIGVST